MCAEGARDVGRKSLFVHSTKAMLGVGIVGLPNVGKSTLFNALTKNEVDAQNYPFCTIDPSVGVVPVPDERLDKLHRFSGSAKKTPSAFEFVDIAGLVAGAADGEGLGNQFLSHIREVDAIAHMVRIFEDDEINHVHGSVDPMHDVEVIESELILADLQTVQRARERIAKKVKGGDKDAHNEHELLEIIEPVLDAGEYAAQARVPDELQTYFNNLHLLTAKPVLYVLNTKADTDNLGPGDDHFDALIEHITKRGAQYVLVDAGLEQELKEMGEEEKREFKSDVGVTADGGIPELIRAGYRLLDLITYFTTGPKETRAWPIQRGWTAPQAGSRIHSDFQKNFIRAEVIRWDELLAAGSYKNAREQGLVRTEGKEYVVKDGDVIEFKI